MSVFQIDLNQEQHGTNHEMDPVLRIKRIAAEIAVSVIVLALIYLLITKLHSQYIGVVPPNAINSSYPTTTEFWYQARNTTCSRIVVAQTPSCPNATLVYNSSSNSCFVLC